MSLIRFPLLGCGSGRADEFQGRGESTGVTVFGVGCRGPEEFRCIRCCS